MLVGVAGAGLIGSGLAHCLSEAGFEVVLADRNDDILEKARHAITSSVNLRKILQKSQIRAEDVLEQIVFSADLQDMSECEFMIEAITEDEPLKLDIWTRLGAICQDTAILASATSAIPITRLASKVPHPERFLGIHFMNPVPLKDTVEMIRGVHTSDETIEKARDLLEQIGKKAILVNDSPGFVSNRVLMLTVNEAIWLVQDRVAEPKDIDRLFKDCFGHKMGPLETADMIGLDTIMQSLQVLQDSFGEDKYRPCPLLRQMVDAGYLGRKSGKGFFEYGKLK